MSADLCLVDSNVLAYALYADGPHHAPSKSLLEKAGNRGAGFCVTSQVLAEFFSIVTNPKRVTVAQSAESAVRAIRAIPVTGGRIFDLQIAATMQGIYNTGCPHALTDTGGLPTRRRLPACPTR